ncbi:heme exporter protein CcmB [Legionella geestiana]|uniref:Heme exporter protein B n=2 Tax=Legionella geestiana TaxID=45065 RepID=A0A0W0UAW7_9GAMM|nr:heme exporter protein CcmB [Legionella geestiana]STX54042.1 heme exporter protein CcmB [Legionella geestiana]
MISLFWRQCMRDLLLVWREFRHLLNASLFFIMVPVFFALTLPADSAHIRTTAPGLFWIATLFAFMLQSERLFVEDFEDGHLEQWILSGYPLYLLAGARLLVHWLSTLLPLLLLTPLIGVFFGFNRFETLVLAASLVCATPALALLCALTAAFSLGVRQRGMLMALVVLPLAVPVMIFGSGAVSAAIAGQAVSGLLALLLAASLLAIILLPFAIAGALRVRVAG